MDPEIIKPVLMGLPLAVLWAAAIMLFAWWARRSDEPARPAESRLAGRGPLRAGAIALGGGMVLGALVYLGPGSFRERPGLDTLPTYVALMAMALALLERFWEGLRFMTWLFRAMFVLAIVVILCGHVGVWTPEQRMGWTIGFSALTLGTWWCWERTAARGPAGPLTFWLVTSMTTLALLTTGSLKGAAVASWLAAGCGGALLTNIFRPRAGATLAGGGSTVFAPTIAALWFAGPNSGSMPLWMMFALAACAPASMLAEVGPIRRLSSWKHAAVRAAIAAVPGLVVLAVALPQAKKDSEDTGIDARKALPGNPASHQSV